MVDDGGPKDCPECDRAGNGRCGKCYGTGINLKLNSDRDKCDCCRGTAICPYCHGTGVEEGGAIWELLPDSIICYFNAVWQRIINSIKR